MRTRIWGTIAIVSLALLGSRVAAQPPGGGPAHRAQPAFDPTTVVNLTGTVEAVERVPAVRGRAHGVHLRLKTDKETVEVRLGPAWYVDAQEPKIKAGDRIDVTGSRVTMHGMPVILAVRVQKGDATLRLRNDDGAPLWSGRGGRRPSH